MSSDNNVVKMNGSKKRILWMDGLKGFACFAIFTAHFMTSVYPRLHFGMAAKSHTESVENIIYSTPLRGGVMVGVFCITAGLLLCRKVMSSVKSADKMRDLGSILVKRYLRLAIPVLPLGILVWLMLKLGLFYNVEAAKYTFSDWLTNYYNRQISITEMLSDVFVKVWFYGDDTISTALWMMYQMFYGSVLSLVLGMMYWIMKKKAVIVYGLTFVFLLPRHDFICGFALGAIIAFLFEENVIDSVSEKLRKDAFWLPGFVGFVLVVIGVVIGGYPLDGEPVGFYLKMKNSFYQCYYSIGGSMIIVGISMTGFLQKFFDCRVMQFLSKISYELFLVHIPVVFSLGMFIMVKMCERNVYYHAAVAVSYFTCLVVTILLSYLYSKYITKWCDFVIVKVSNWLCRD